MPGLAFVAQIEQLKTSSENIEALKKQIQSLEGLLILFDAFPGDSAETINEQVENLKSLKDDLQIAVIEFEKLSKQVKKRQKGQIEARRKKIHREHVFTIWRIIKELYLLWVNARYLLSLIDEDARISKDWNFQPMIPLKITQVFCVSLERFSHKTLKDIELHYPSVFEKSGYMSFDSRENVDRNMV
jgi:hypothetical protein